MIRVGVTGSNGFIGWHLCRTLELLSKNFELIKFQRDWFNDSIHLDNFFLNCDIVVHLAGINRHIDESLIYETNIKLTKKIIESCTRTGFKGQLIFSSSIQEEKDNLFGSSKKVSRDLFTNWATESGSRFQGLIVPNVFGAFALPYYNSVIATFCHQLVNDESPKIEKDASLKLIYINDLIKQIIDLFNTETKSKLLINHTNTYRVSELLNLLLEYKSIYFLNGQIPIFNNQFEIDLFNTFRSYFNLKNLYPIKYKNNIDERGNFVEIIKLGNGGQVSFSSTKIGTTRGNHYHVRKIERFSVIKGKALIQLRKKGSTEILNFYLSGDEPSYVDMPIWYVHNIKNIGDEELYTMFWINEFYDINDPDTFFEKV
jgi:UDP-2-acetamido-2,6-beta-L-arabino-hexul-4-ose reductase